MRNVVKMFLGTGLFLIALSFLPLNSAHAENLVNDHNKLFEVQTESIMRTAPDEEAERIGNLIEGDRLRTFEEVDGWVKTFYDGQPVWVYSDELLLIEDNSTPVDMSEVNEEQEKMEEKPSEEKQDDNGQEEKKSEVDANQIKDKNNPSDQPEDFFFEKYQPESLDEKDELPVGIYKPKEVQISEDTIVVTKNKLNGYTILIDAGHGGEDAGATNDGVYEKNITLATAKRVAEHLKQEGATVNFTRKDDTFISLQNRVKHSNTQETDVFISFHYDYFSDSSVNGINTYYYNNTTSGNLAKKVHASLANNLDMNNRGIKNADYYVLAQNQNPAILLELGFMTNPEDLEKMQTEGYQEAVAKAITEGLMEYFNE